MATIKVVQDKRRAKKDGTYPLYIRIIHQSKPISIALRISLLPEYWDEGLQQVRRTYLNHKLLNHKISKKVLEIEEQLLELERESSVITTEDIHAKLRGEKKDLTFLEFSREEVERMKKAGKYGNARTYEIALSRLKNYLGNKDLRFEQLDYNFLTRFETTLLEEGLKVNAISVYLRTIRAIYNKAIKAGMIDRAFYPFHDFKINSEKTLSRSLTRKEMEKIAELELPVGSPIWRNREYFLLSFYLIGISFIDLAMLRVKDIQDGRVIYKRRKTGKIYNIKLTGRAEKIIGYFCDLATVDKEDFVLPIIPNDIHNLEEQMRKARSGYHYCNKYLKKIARFLNIRKPVTTYYARYSWANIAKGLGYSKDLIAEALGHEYGNKVTGIYLDGYNNEVIDEANEEVTSL